MLLEKEGNRIYIKYNKENYFGYLSGIISIGIAVIFFIKYYEEINLKTRWINDLIHGTFFRTLFIIGIITFIIISIIDKLFFKDYNYYLDLQDNKIHLINGRWKFKDEVTIDFGIIRNILITKTVEMVNRYGKTVDRYKIDIYDNELNAYEILNDYNYTIIINKAKELSEILVTEIIERTDINNYEEFRRRII
jgi:hypothetical protein